MYNTAMPHYETPSPPSDIFVSGHFREQYGYAVQRSHGSGNWLITYTLEGEGHYRLYGEMIWARPGDIILLKPGTPHDYSVPLDGLWNFFWAHFQPRVDWFSWWNLPELQPGLFKATLRTSHSQERAYQAFLQLHTDSNASLLEQAHQTASARALLRRELALNRLEELLLLTTLETEQERQRLLDPRVQQVLDIISKNLSAQHTVATLAHEVALSPSRLAHLFKQEIGDSLISKLVELRLAHAARLLTFTNDSIATIADEAGFHSAFYFSRQFQQHFGMSPRAYRTTQKQHS